MQPGREVIRLIFYFEGLSEVLSEVLSEGLFEGQLEGEIPHGWEVVKS